MLAQEIIAHKRDSKQLSSGQITEFVAGITDGSVGDDQAAAFAMAVYLNGMSAQETVALTGAMKRSGEVLDWSGIADGRPVLDKHSTGGVGDTVSLMLAPALAACGALVPMISGRGLGQTGGTLDKLDSIPGYQTAPDAATFTKVTKEIGCAIIGQTGDLAPADRRLYAIRDVTATVESVPLITASILSKKLAAGLDGLVLDVKTGSGAFAASRAMADDLANSLVEVGEGAGLSTTALITDMNEPLGHAAGNAVEVACAIDFLTGRRRDRRLEAITLALGGLAPSAKDGERRIAEAFNDGRAAEHFSRMVEKLGGPADLIEQAERHLAPAPLIRALAPARAGHIIEIDTAAIGLAVIELGGGRRRAEDAIDHRVGLTELAGIGDEAASGNPLCIIHARDEAGFEAASRRILNAYRLAEAKPATHDPVLARIGRARP
ncbi:MAG: thymidine phosphorylase [Rhizobiales bacterium]|nr:thymidine phosphorylase [Hyphomicrobiales bacterium]